MNERTLRNRRILVVEDEYLIAKELEGLLEDTGAEIIGPVGTIKEALQLIRSEQPIHCALVDINLHGVMSFETADALLDRAIPFVFATGYDEAIIPSRFRSIARCSKPIQMYNVVKAIENAAAALDPDTSLSEA